MTCERCDGLMRARRSTAKEPYRYLIGGLPTIGLVGVTVHTCPTCGRTAVTIPKVGLLRAQIERAKAEQDLLRSRNGYESMRLALATALDREADFEVVEPGEPALPADLSALRSQALRDRPEVKSAREAEALGYRSFWVNHPGPVDGPGSLAYAAAETRRVSGPGSRPRDSSIWL